MCGISMHLKGALNKGDCLAGARGAKQGQGVAAPSCPNQDRCYSFSLLTVQLLRSQLIQKARLPVHLAQAGQLIWFCPLHTHTFRCQLQKGCKGACGTLKNAVAVESAFRMMGWLTCRQTKASLLLHRQKEDKKKLLLLALTKEEPKGEVYWASLWFTGRRYSTAIKQ